MLLQQVALSQTLHYVHMTYKEKDSKKQKLASNA